jgi:outer membrane protein TolC
MRHTFVIRGAASATAGLLALAASAGWSQVEPRGAAGDPFPGAERLEREALQAAVLERNPSLAAARAALDAAEARAAAAGALPDLSISYGLAPLSVGSSAVETGYEVEAMQMLPFRGRRGLRRSIAAAEAEGAAEELAGLRLTLAEEASLRYDDYYLVRRSQEINDEHVALLEDLFRAATGRYAAGLASQQDPLQAELELAHLHHEQVVLQSEEDAIRAEINALLHRAAAAELPPPADELSLPLEPFEPWTDEARLLEQALARRPELRSAEAAIRARETELELARLGARPDFGVGAGYSAMWAEAEHRVMIGGTLTFPVGRRRVRAEIAEAEARLSAARAAEQAQLDAIRRDVHVAAARLREAHHVVDIYRSRLLPAAGDQVRAARAGFESGRNDFASLIGAARGLRSIELRYDEALASFYRYQAALARAVGSTVLAIASDRSVAADAAPPRPPFSLRGARP